MLANWSSFEVLLLACNVALGIVVLYTVLPQHCHCACAVLYSVYRFVVSRARRSMQQTSPSKPSSAEREPHRTDVYYDLLLKTEKYFIDAGYFAAVNNVTILDETSFAQPFHIHRRVKPEFMLSSALDIWEASYPHYHNPAKLSYQLYRDGLVDAVLHY